MNIAVIVGSLREGSFNLSFARAVEGLLPEGSKFNYIDIDLPLFNEDSESNVSESVKQAKATVEAADGILIVTPEYNRGMPGVLKNAVDWISRPYGSNSFNGKPVAIAGVSGGPIGTAASQQQLKAVMLYLNARVMGQPEMYLQAGRIFEDDRTVKSDASELVQNFVDAVVSHIENQK